MQAIGRHVVDERAFGGSQRKTLVATVPVAGTVLRAELEHAGLPVHRARAGT